MKVTRKDIDRLNAVLTVHIEAADYAEKYEKEIKQTRKNVDMPGFRRGMVPKSLIEKLYGTSIKARVINDVLSDGLFNYIKEEKLDVLGEPLPNENEESNDISFERDTEFDFLFDIALAPEININYGVEVPVYDITVDDSMVEEQVLNLCQRYGNYSQPETAGDDDIITGVLTECADENPIVNDRAMLTISRLKDEDQKNLLRNAKKDDVITFNPRKAMQEDAEIAAFIGKKADEIKDNDHDFTFAVTNISHYAPAEVGKELFDKIYGPDAVQDEKEFRQRVSEDIKSQLHADEDYRFEIDAREALMSQFKDLELPEAFLRRFLKLRNEKVDDETFDKEFPAALEALKWQLIEDKIVEKNGISVQEDDLKAEAENFIRMQLRQYGLNNHNEQLVKQFAEDTLKRNEDKKRISERALTVKIFDALRKDLKLKATSISLSDFNKLFEKAAEA